MRLTGEKLYNLKPGDFVFVREGIYKNHVGKVARLTATRIIVEIKYDMTGAGRTAIFRRVSTTCKNEGYELRGGWRPAHISEKTTVAQLRRIYGGKKIVAELQKS